MIELKAGKPVMADAMKEYMEHHYKGSGCPTDCGCDPCKQGSTTGCGNCCILEWQENKVHPRCEDCYYPGKGMAKVLRKAGLL